MFKLKKTTILLIAIVSLLLSKAIFLFIADLEGPNLIVTAGLTGVIFIVLLSVFMALNKVKKY